MSRTYYNDIDSYGTSWIRKQADSGIINTGDISNKNIKDILPEEISDYDRVHFFAGIGGWDYALRIAGWPEDRTVWTGSCPCQPFSSAGKRKGTQDDRHLWPHMFRLIRECRPQCVFGEQVASAIGHGWLDGISADLEAEGYTVGAAVLGAHSIGAPHKRQRLYWVAHTNSNYAQRRAVTRKQPGEAGSVATKTRQRQRGGVDSRSSGSLGGLGLTVGTGLERHAGDEHVRHEPRRLDTESCGPVAPAIASCWGGDHVVWCRDLSGGPSIPRRVEPGTFPLAYGVPRDNRPMLARLHELGVDPKTARGIVAAAKRNRVSRLRVYGNAIVPQVSAEFIKAFLDVANVA